MMGVLALHNALIHWDHSHPTAISDRCLTALSLPGFWIAGSHKFPCGRACDIATSMLPSA
jgi:hypothetical protein